MAETWSKGKEGMKHVIKLFCIHLKLNTDQALLALPFKENISKNLCTAIKNSFLINPDPLDSLLYKADQNFWIQYKFIC